MKFPVTKYGLLRLLPLVFDVEPPAAAKITYFRGEASARLQWDKRGVFSAYRFDFRNGQFLGGADHLCKRPSYPSRAARVRSGFARRRPVRRRLRRYKIAGLNPEVHELSAAELRGWCELPEARWDCDE